MGAEKCIKCADIPRPGVSNRWVRDVGMRRVKSLEEQLSKTVVQDLGVRNF